MPLRPPILDDRRYDDLVAELVARIPAHTPEWTHPRAGDPGRTLIELFAWMGDALLYRVNLVPERQRLAFLRLLGQPLRPARAAEGIVTVSLRETEGPVPLMVVTPARLTGPGELAFESRTDLMILPVTGSCWVKRETSIDPALEAALSSFHVGHFPDTGSGAGAIAPYLTEPLFAGNRPEETGFDIVTQTVDHCLWLALLASKAGDTSTVEGAALQRARNEIVAEILGGKQTAGRALLNLGFVPALPAGDALEPATIRARVPHLWEVTANLSGQEPTPEVGWSPEYLRLDKVGDTTQGLTRPGVIRLALPSGRLLYAPSNDVREDMTAGVGDRPPRLDDEAVASRLVGWIRLRPAPAAAAPAPAATEFQPEKTGVAREFANPADSGSTLATMTNEVAHLPVTWLGINAVEVEQLTTLENVVVGTSSGGPDQEFALPTGSVDPASLQLEIEEDGVWRAWQRVEDLLTFSADPRVSRDARAFTLDPEAGIFRFGDDVYGRIPPAEARIRARRFRHGGGVAGNLPAATLRVVSANSLATGEAIGAKLVVVQPLEFTGGAAAETLAEAEKRIPARLRHRERAVTSEDYAAVARTTPGVAVGRVELLPRFKPQQRFFNVPGVVSVLVLPDRPFAPAPNPRADRPFLEAIHGWLDARRPLGTELYVIGCEYVPIATSVAVTIRDGHDPEATLQEVKDTLRRVLWPLVGGGFDGRGWPLGHALSNRELAVEIARLPGVSEVAGLNLFLRPPQNVSSAPEWLRIGDSATGAEQNVSLDPYQLPELLRVHAVADDTLRGAPLDLGNSANPQAKANAVAVPVVPRLC